MVLLLILVALFAACGNTDTKLKVTGLDRDNGDVEGGTYVRVYGENFLNPTRSAKVWFGHRQGTVIRFASDTELIVEAPGGAPNETVDVLITFEPGGEKVLKNGFTFKEKNERPSSVNDLDTSKTK